MYCHFYRLLWLIASQPKSLPKVAVVEPRRKPKAGLLVVTIVLTVLCGLHLNLPAFICMTPALVFAIVVSTLIL